MDSKEKVLSLHDYFHREIKKLLNPSGENRSSVIANKITSILVNSKKHGWAIERDTVSIKKILAEKITKHDDQELAKWYGDLKTVYEEETDEKMEKVIEFYIEKFDLTDEEKVFYKEFQNKNY